MTGIYAWGMVLSAATSLATTFVNRPLGEVVKGSHLIVKGRAGDSYSDWAKDGSRALYTYTHFTISDILKGELKETRILLRQPGGSKDGMEMSVPGAANFAPDEDVVVLLGKKEESDGSYHVPGLATGKYDVKTGPNGEPVLVNAMGGGAMYDPSKDARALSYNSTIPLEVFKRIARGEDIPEAAHRQYEGSAKPPARGAIDDHGHHKGVAPAKPSLPKKEAGPTGPPAVEPPADAAERSLWIPISFVLLALLAGAGFWWFLGERKGGK